MGSHTDYEVPSAEAIKITARKLNLLYGELSEGEFLSDSAPFEVGYVQTQGAVDWVVQIKPGQAWNVATVLEKVLRKELPVTNRDREKVQGGFGHSPSQHVRDPETGKIETKYTYGNPHKPFIGD